MFTRASLFALAGVLVYGTTATAAEAGDFGVSFQYSSHSPRYYSTGASRSYTVRVPRDTVYYDDCYYYEAPVAYVDCSTPRAVVYDDCYPTTYRTTYTRSRYYTRPVRHSRVSTRYRSGGHSYQHRKHVAYRRHCSTPRRSTRVYSRPSGPRYYRSISTCRPGSSRYYRSSSPSSHRSPRVRYHRSPPRVRIYHR